MDAIEQQVKQTIIDVVGPFGQPSDLDDDATLSAVLKYNDLMCGDLQNRLNEIIKDKGCDQFIKNGDITPDKCVGDVVKLVKDNLAKC